MTATTTRPTWAELVKLEPRLGRLLDRVKAIKDDKRKPSFCANAVWYGGYREEGFKGRFKRLIGWTSSQTDPRLRSMDAYQVAYAKLYAALPDCRNCNCF